MTWLRRFVILTVIAATGGRVSAGCPDARYVIDGQALDGLRIDFLAIAGRHLSVEPACPHRSARLRSMRQGRRRWLVGTLEDCGTERRRIRTRLRFHDRCSVLVATLRTNDPGHTFARLTATRSVCGDGTWDVGNGEGCDGDDLAGQTCDSTLAQDGVLRCSESCTLDFRECTPRLPVCGNGVREAAEACDGSDLAGQACPQGGTLRCRVDCAGFDVRDCFACGNAVRESSELCDGPDVGGATCNAPGETGGHLACTSGCTFDRAGCFRCGNGRLDPGEDCDDGNASDLDRCRTDCTTTCGDGVHQFGEQCDDGNATDSDGCSALCLLEASVAGGGGEFADACTAVWWTPGIVSPGVTTCTDGDPACDRNAVAGSCTVPYTVCFNVEQFLPGACQPTDVQDVALLAGTTLDPEDRAAVLARVAETLDSSGGVVEVETGRVHVSPPAEGASLCNTALVTMRVGTSQQLSVAVTDSAGVSDHDTLTFACAAEGP